ncbi:exopolyphosphatase-like enzyme [Caldisphaera lagunensis DSM 15908]|uniref:Exopolyphosphatase-like enzyme n=1 Tax=Caldisphaera lagunensis (strain DSM 15908 / JCM 11604 / ANMR 0165 / IC-154) TaxID=1056495 RepID=L0ADE3_CALLD|nr:DHH family phosphoesterase [Caldisphaera lagunensis]AFZ71132.1 exopolyphosphatase-like enzyme [Caldisphaera lagunensis DSM 15908]
MIKTNTNNFLNDFINELKNGNIGISFHSNADLDAIASSLITYELCKRYNEKCCIDLKQGLSKESIIALKEINIEIKKCDFNYDKLILLDNAGIEQVSNLISNKNIPLIVIDHHREGKIFQISKLYYIDDDASSTTEIVSSFASKLTINLDENISTLGILGILFDSNRLERASKSTLESLLYLMKNGDYKKAISIYYKIIKGIEEDFSIKMAKLKGFSRAIIGKVCKDLIAVVTEIGSYESIVSRTLIQNGADVAFTIKYKEGEDIRISIRISDKAISKGIDASNIARIVADKYNGEGGGHIGASIVTIKNKKPIEKEKFFSYLVNLINGICKESG